jgi:hypothetical protein
MVVTCEKRWPKLALLACAAWAAAAASGCTIQTQMGGQTLPSAYYLQDDVQYFPAGPEFLIPNEAAALEQYRLEQQAIEDGLLEPPLP